MRLNRMVGDVVNLVLAAWLFLSPWIVGFAGQMPAAWTAWLTAIAIAVFAVAALAAFAEWEEWINLALGLWALISPWVLGFTGQPATVVLFFTGLAVAIVAAVELWIMHHTPPRITTA